MRTDKRSSQKADKKGPSRVHKRGVVGYSKKSALLEEAITHMNTGKYGRSSAALKELLALDPHNTEARRLFATLHLRLGSLVTARQAFESLANEAIGRQDYWLAESLLREYLAAGPRCVPFLEQLAHVYQEKGDEMAAVGELGKAIEILRDDPDAENPQKAAQLYSKIRELAPASPVAFQLAPLFDVQTGEFLVRPSSSSLPTDEEPYAGPQPAAVAEAPLPEVMPWDVVEDSLPSADVQSSFASSSESTVSAPAGADGTAVLETPDVLQPFIAEIQSDESCHDVSLAGDALITTTPPEGISSEGMTSTTTATSEASDPSSLSSPMPWEQVADASVQIVETEPSRDPDPYSSLESILASLRAEEKSGTLTTPLDVSSAPVVVVEHAPAVTAESPTSDASASSLTAPMPWEQVSDGAMQIPEIQASVAPTVSGIDAAIGTSMSAAVQADAFPAPTDPRALQTETTVPERDVMGPRTDDSSEMTSFSWNSVFDKAWKFAAGTIAPSPDISTEPERPRSLPQSDGHGDDGSPSAGVASDAAFSPLPADDSVIVPPPVATPFVTDTSLPPVLSDPYSAGVQEPAIPEATPVSGESSAPPLSVPPSDAPSHWNTGEVAVQVHRPTKKKNRWDKESVEAQPQTAGPSSSLEDVSDRGSEAVSEWKTMPTDPVASSVVEIDKPVEEDTRPDWMRASDAITFHDQPAPAPAPMPKSWTEAEVALPQEHAEAAPFSAASAVDVLFSPGGNGDDVRTQDFPSWSKPRPRLVARLHRVRIAASSFVGSCFSTTRSLTFLSVMLATAIVAVAGTAIGLLGVVWMVMEEPPSAHYQNLTIIPARVVTDVKKNGYLLLLGFDAPAQQDPVQAGYERKAERQTVGAAQACMGGDDARDSPDSGGASAHLVKGWFRSGDPASQIKGQSGTIRSLATREAVALQRYQQWLTMPFDDWGYGQMLSPNCSHVLFAHRLYLMEGFSQDMSTGLDRLDADFLAWRAALAQSKTLIMKMLAVTAVQDDASMASGLLSRVELDGNALAKISKMVRPLDQVELSVRWPMQSQFMWGTKMVPSELKDKSPDRPWHASMAAAMRLPVQRRANAYAEYYDAANKAVAGGRYTSLPKRSTFVRTPASGPIDYLTNPIEHLVGLEPLPSWDPYVMRMIEADAQLRLVGLQAWLRRGPQDGDVLMRLAKAGQAYYDPFTGLPMLVNQRRGLIYSIGRDGKDQEGDRLNDVVVALPPGSSFDARRSTSSSSR